MSINFGVSRLYFWLTITYHSCIMVRQLKGVFFIMATKKNKIILTCTECLSRNYSTTKNKMTSTERLELNKFCKKCGKHTLHKETR